MPTSPRAIAATHRRLALVNLKRCPLCGTVNSKSSDECCVCGWHGEFDCDPVSVQAGLAQVLEQCPELVAGWLVEPAAHLGLFERWGRWVRARMRKPLDFRI